MHFRTYHRRWSSTLYMVHRAPLCTWFVEASRLQCRLEASRPHQWAAKRGCPTSSCISRLGSLQHGPGRRLWCLFHLPQQQPAPSAQQQRELPQFAYSELSVLSGSGRFPGPASQPCSTSSSWVCTFAPLSFVVLATILAISTRIRLVSTPPRLVIILATRLVIILVTRLVVIRVIRLATRLVTILVTM